MAEQIVELAPGESKQVSFEAIPNEARVYQVSVDGLTGSFTAAAAPVAPPFNISGSGVGLLNPDATAWWYPDLTFTIINPHSVQIGHTLQLWVRSVSLAGYAPGEPMPVTRVNGADVLMTPPGMETPILVNIAPGASFIYRYTGKWTSIPYDGFQYYTSLLSRPRSFFFWLQDELGNKSPEVNIVRS